MTQARFTIAYADSPSHRATVVTELLRARGHTVEIYAHARTCLAAGEPDVYFVARTLSDGGDGLELLESLRQKGTSAPIILLDERPLFDDMRRAIELGATDVVLRPLEEGDLDRALSRASTRLAAARTATATSSERPPVFECTYACDESTVGRAARELSAFLVNEGVANPHRVRIASAVAELVDNAYRHGYSLGAGKVRVRAELRRTRVELLVEDSGGGFDVERAKLESIPAALPRPRASRSALSRSSTNSSTPSLDGGLGRVARLCERHTLSSSAGGTRAELTFELTPVRFEKEPEHLFETDFLDPARARSLIAALRRCQSDLSGVAPGMALTIGRILGGLDAEARVRAPR